MSHVPALLIVLLVLVLLCTGVLEPAEVDSMLLLITTVYAITPQVHVLSFPNGR